MSRHSMRHTDADQAHRKEGALSPDQIADQKLASALAKISDPPKAEDLIGKVIIAGEQTQTPPPISSYSSQKETTKLDLPKAPTIPASPGEHKSSYSVVNGATAQLPPHKLTSKSLSDEPGESPILHKSSKAQSINDPKSENIATSHSVKATNLSGPLKPTELLHFAATLKKNTNEVKPTITSNVIAPTNPDPDATIALAVSEKAAIEANKLEAEKTEKAKKLSVTPAKFVEKKLDIHKMYLFLALWLIAIPCAFIISAIVGIFEDKSIPKSIDLVFTIIEILLGIYGLLGWIPLVVLYMQSRKD